ncbi:uncharacterized protein TRAVEDRAFT_46245 [Trametes versicolor FP-101664 SS1]|uniref:uncharacterized protein n=1 Tax=Trametes versicolor (strain FP-101664) TaxID=717944 RepID=UPI0004621CF1|nr:uncharacterized protein TRAVEDRAFT_46245 [Trametes versicolor FP-101664 SS1]EIW61020.1 hypothetical protein TRAVEDRAFT_46245 [Trametes versicolor FP-101664 SS1]
MGEIQQTPLPLQVPQWPVIPYDVFIEICSFLTIHEISVLALISRMWNEAATIALYEHIDLFQPRAIWCCVKTLSLPPETTSFARDLAVFPRSIHIRRPLFISVTLESETALGEMMQQLLPRLINLHSFSCDLSLPNVPRILLRTTESRRVPLRTLDLLIAEDYRPFDQVSEDDFGLKDVPLDHWPALSSLGVHIYSNSNAPYDEFFKHTVLHSQHHLRALSLSVRPELLVTVWDVLSRIPVFRCLEKLQTSLPVKFLLLPCFTQAPRLKSLNIHYFGSTTAWPPFQETDYRALEPQLAYLESLDLLIEYSGLPDLDPLNLGTRLIAHLPRLHTFLLSDGPLKLCGGFRHAFPWAGDEALQRQVLADFDRRSSVLRRVAFTTEFEWEKRADGQWHAWGHVVPERPLLPLGRYKERVGLDE